MATLDLIKTGAGTVPKPVKIVLGKEGNLSAQVIASINAFQTALVRKINGRLSFGDAAQSSRAGNFFGQYREFTTPGTPNEQFTVDHGLKKVVVGRFVVRQDKAAHLYDVNLGGWGDNSVYFKCDIASVLFKVLLLADPGS